MVIGSIGIIGILNVKEKKNLSKLNHFTKDIYEAANLFVETNEEIKKEMYSSKNAVAISLEKLESEGLLDFADIDIDGHYVLTFLGSDVPSGYKIRLKPCMKIVSDSGVGSSSSPFVIKNNCS